MHDWAYRLPDEEERECMGCGRKEILKGTRWVKAPEEPEHEP
jgi:hypothetical protein